MDLFAYDTGMSAVTDSIDFAGDYDVYRVELTGGFNYAATVLGASNLGGTLQDPYVQVYDSQSRELLYQLDDSQILGYDPLLEFQAPFSGTYDIVVGGIGENSGSYTFTVDHGGVPTYLSGLPEGL